MVDVPPTLRAIEEKERAHRLLRQGDLLIEKSGGGDNQPVGCVVDFNHTFTAVCSNFIGRMRVASGMWPRYWTYIHASLYSGRLNIPAIKQTTGIQNLDTDAYFNQRVPFPPREEQRDIADYLDRETARLDALVAAKERVLGLLAEKRRALITRAVTRGLDPRAALRDPDIPWLGEIPAHWDVIPLKHACELIKDGTHLPPERTMTGIPLLSVRNVVGETFQLLSDDSLIAEEDYEVLCRGFRVEKNDVLLAIVGATLGKVAVVGDMPRFHIQRSLASLRANPMLLDFRYLASCLRSDWFQTNLWESVSFSAQPGIYLGSLRDFVVTRPPIDEQRAIVAHVSAETKNLDAVRSATERTIALLGERRSALITAAVRGQIEVDSAA